MPNLNWYQKGQRENECSKHFRVINVRFLENEELTTKFDTHAFQDTLKMINPEEDGHVI